MSSLAGKILIASPRLADPNFRRAIILLVRDDEEAGTLGLVLNRPLEVTVKEACEDVIETTCNIDAMLYQGGPCDGPIMILHDQESSGQMTVAPGIYFTSDKDGVEELLSSGAERLKCFVGYSGWEKGQLAGEIEEGAWLSCPATVELVLEEIHCDWSKLLTHLTYGSELPMDRIPDDPSLN